MQRGSVEKSDYTFTNLSGQSMADPRPGIDANPDTKIDYQAFHPLTKTAITERWGLRETQEDRVIAEELPDFMFLSSVDREQALDKTIRALQAEIDRERQANRVGSTLCATVLCGNTIYNASVGDSESFLVVRDANNSIVRFERLNTTLHDINEENLASLKQAGFKIYSSAMTGDRLVDVYGRPGINMYRAMGDLAYEGAGLQHHPDIFKVQVDIPLGGNAFVINACDGMTERMSQADLEEIIEKNRQASLKDLPLILTNAALQSGSSDNISVMVTPVELDARPKYMAVFDGHGGTLVSHFLSQRFHQVLLKNSREQLFAPLSQEQNTIVQRQIESWSDTVKKLNPAAGVSSLYATINYNFYTALARGGDSEKKAELITQYWDRIIALTQRVSNALLLSANLDLGLPSSFSPEFKEFNANKKIKDAIAFVEAQAKAALIAFENPPETKRDEFLAQVVKHLESTVDAAYAMVKEEQRNEKIRKAVALLGTQLPNFLKSRPQYQSILQKAQAAIKTFDDKRVDIDSAVDEILFSLYLEAYRQTREKKLFSSSAARDDISPVIEKMIMTRCPEIAAVVPRKGINNTLVNRILWYAGERFGDFSQLVLAQLSAAENKKMFVNTGKLLGRLGNAGFQMSSQFFAGKDDRYVDKSEIEKFYDKNIKDRSSEPRP
jgi:serine/threonine protein phosphatase PrpC